MYTTPSAPPSVYVQQTDVSGQMLSIRSDAAKLRSISHLEKAGVRQTGAKKRLNASGCERSGKAEIRSERTYRQGRPDAATSERLSSADSRLERLILSDPAVRADYLSDRFVPSNALRGKLARSYFRNR
jgi:hypothetical protein